MKTGLRNGPSGLESGKEEEIGIVGVGYILFVLAFEDSKLHNGRRVDGAPIS